VLRLLLGVAEAGFYPGVIYYLTQWLPRGRRAEFIALFLFAIPLANIFGAPVSSWLLLHGAYGHWRDWQVLLLAESAPALLLGCLTPWLLTDVPEQAQWLSEIEREKLLTNLANDRQQEQAQVAARSLMPGLRGDDLAPLMLCCWIYFVMQIGLYALGFWMPQMLADAGLRQMTIGWTVAAIYAADAAFTFAWAKWTDRGGQPWWALAAPMAVSALGFLVALVATWGGSRAVVPMCIGLTLAASGGLAASAPLWSALTRAYPGERAAIAVATVNSLGNLGGFVGPSLLGFIAAAAGGFALGDIAVAGLLITGAAAAGLLWRLGDA
jgi:ACS family tartrate transporter-like MFS transporter